MHHQQSQLESTRSARRCECHEEVTVARKHQHAYMEGVLSYCWSLRAHIPHIVLLVAKPGEVKLRRPFDNAIAMMISTSGANGKRYETNSPWQWKNDGGQSREMSELLENPPHRIRHRTIMHVQWETSSFCPSRLKWPFILWYPFSFAKDYV